MTTLTGSSLRKTSSANIESWSASLAGGLGICLVFGVAIAAADAMVRLPLHLPGWRGLIAMALLVLARRLNGRAWGATGTAFVAAAASLASGEISRFGPLTYLVPGLIIDVFCLIFSARLNGRRNSLLILGMAAGLANAGKFAVTLFGMAALAPRNTAGALLLPLLSHFGFGLCGGLLAMLFGRHPKSKPDGAANL